MPPRAAAFATVLPLDCKALRPASGAGFIFDRGENRSMVIGGSDPCSAGPPVLISSETDSKVKAYIIEWISSIF